MSQAGPQPLGLALAQALERMTAASRASAPNSQVSQGGSLPALGYGPTLYSAEELSRRAETLRRQLVEALAQQPSSSGRENVLPGRVAFLLPNHPTFVMAWLASLAQGLLAIPLNPVLTTPELVRLVRLAQPQLLLTHALTRTRARALLAHLSALHPEGVSPVVLELAHPLHPEGASSAPPASLNAASGSHPFERLLQHELSAGPAGAPAEEERLELNQADSLLQPRAVGLNHPALLLFTSGTTGQPKGILHSHGSLSHNAGSIAHDWLGGLLGEPPPPPLPGRLCGEERHRMLGALPLCHNFGLNVTLDATLLHGGLLELLPLPSIRLLHDAVEGRFRPLSSLEGLGSLDVRTFKQAGVTALPLTPPLFRSLLLALPEGEGLGMRLAISGGAALPGALRDAFRQRFPSLALRDTYGLTEASLVSCTRPPPPDSGQAGDGKPGTVGRPIADTHLLILDDAGEPCPVGTPGEVVVRGPGLMLGVLEGDGTLLPPPLEGLRTGDIGQRDADGDLTLLDRKKDLILHGGQNVYPLEVEEVLYRHPAVREALVYGVPDARMGEKVMAAVALVPEEAGVSTAPDAEGLRAFCRKSLSPYKVPLEIEIRPSLPRGSTGKLLRRQLKEDWLARKGLEPSHRG